jgi:Molecular chaperone (small heat shock protein)
VAWRDYRDMLRQMEYDMHRFSEEAFGFLEPSNRFWQPSADVHETQAGIVIKMELAGVTSDNVNVSLSGDSRRLTVSGIRAERPDEREKRIGCHQLEVYFGPFERTFGIPPDYLIERDQITATLRDGFLTITLPRREQTVVSRTIPIEVQSSNEE